MITRDRKFFSEFTCQSIPAVLLFMREEDIVTLTCELKSVTKVVDFKCVSGASQVKP